VRVFFPLIKAGLVANGITATMRQSYQPTEQGAERDNALYFFKLDDKRIGHPQRKSEWDALSGKEIDTDTQLHEATWQISAWVRQTPTSDLTASDVLATTAMIMQGSQFIEALKAQGFGIMRITDLRNPYFKDERDQFQASPSFDFTLSYNRTLVRDGRVISDIRIDTDRV
jgi:hypothetical protein